MSAANNDIIAAIATPPGRGGVGIVRISGPDLSSVLERLHTKSIAPRLATYSHFTDREGNLIDQGLILYFPAPHSFTGEDVIELQGHGGPVVMDALLTRVLELGARLAQPGEFSQRAFLNDKIDLAQAEAIADLIDASTQEAARGAIRSLQGVFSERINRIVDSLIELRVYVEAAIDFPEEEIDFLSDGFVLTQLRALLISLEQVIGDAAQGSLLREGMTVVIAGKPNAGKSSLLNALAGRDTAIVTDVAGTTRDVLKERIHVDGMPLHIVDTAGLRETDDPVEQEGVRRAWQEIEQADRILLVVDAVTSDVNQLQEAWPAFFDRLSSLQHLTVVLNKVDLLADAGAIPARIQGELPIIPLSAKKGLGMDTLKEHLKKCMGFRGAGEGSFVARRRHLEALAMARQHIELALGQLQQRGAGELVAEDLRYAQRLLGEITGQFTTDELLGKIFTSFCIGK